MSPLRVAVGIIQCGDRVLVSRRRSGQHLAGLWEFPGGKIEPGEALGTALSRELWEELGIRPAIPSEASPWKVIDYHYPEKTVRLEFVRVLLSAPEGEGREGQEIRWVSVAELHRINFPEANAAVVAHLQLESA